MVKNIHFVYLEKIYQEQKRQWDLILADTDGTGQQPDSNYIILFKADAALYCSVCFFVVLKECISASLDWHCMWYSYSKLVDMQI